MSSWTRSTSLLFCGYPRSPSLKLKKHTADPEQCQLPPGWVGLKGHERTNVSETCYNNYIPGLAFCSWNPAHSDWPRPSRPANYRAKETGHSLKWCYWLNDISWLLSHMLCMHVTCRWKPIDVFDAQRETWSMSYGSCIKPKSTPVTSTSLPATGSFVRTPASPALEVDLFELKVGYCSGKDSCWEPLKNREIKPQTLNKL